MGNPQFQSPQVAMGVPQPQSPQVAMGNPQFQSPQVAMGSPPGSVGEEKEKLSTPVTILGLRLRSVR